MNVNKAELKKIYSKLNKATTLLYKVYEKVRKCDILYDCGLDDVPDNVENGLFKAEEAQDMLDKLIRDGEKK